MLEKVIVSALRLITEFFLGGLMVMLLTEIVFPIFGHPGLSYWTAAVVALLFGGVLSIVSPSKD